MSNADYIWRARQCKAVRHDFKCVTVRDSAPDTVGEHLGNIDISKFKTARCPAHSYSTMLSYLNDISQSKYTRRPSQPPKSHPLSLIP